MDTKAMISHPKAKASDYEKLIQDYEIHAAPGMKPLPLDASAAINSGLEAAAKATNPKDSIGATKLPLSWVPESALVFLAMAFTEGGIKYGPGNWQESGVRVSIYIDAAKRHVAKFMAGEWVDPKTGIPHLASAMACYGIILDADMLNKLTDDRPVPNTALPDLIDAGADLVKHLKELYGK